MNNRMHFRFGDLWMTEHGYVASSTGLVDGLSSAGITRELLVQAIDRGAREYNFSSKFHPKTNAGYRAWSSIVAQIREDLCSNFGWKSRDEGLLPIVYNSEQGLSLIICSGSDATGNSSVDNLTTRNPKGLRTKMHVQNNTSLNLFDDQESEEVQVIDPTQTWFFLYYFDFQNKEVRFEVSLATDFYDKKPTGWKYRIFFDSFSMNDSVQIETRNVQEFNEDIDFSIEVKV
jgi:hypothetical protein